MKRQKNKPEEKKTPIHKIKEIFKYTLTILVISSSALLIIAGMRAESNNDLIRVFGYSYAIVPTKSMEGEAKDALFAGDIVVVKNISYQDLVIGDIIVFQSQSNGRPIRIVHRIVDVTDQGHFVTRGDNNPSDDQNPVTETIYLGKVVNSYHMAFLSFFILQYRAYLFLVIALVLVIMLFSEIKTIFQTLKEKDEVKLKQKAELEKDALLNENREKLKEELIEELKSNKNQKNE